MATTNYLIFAGTDTEARATKSKKSVATDLALEIRNDEKVATRVETANGKVVAEFAAPKKINMSKPYTRVVALPEGVVAPEGTRVAYVRKQAGLALLHRPDVAREDRPYSFLNLKTGKEQKSRFETTREAGKAFVAARAAVKSNA